MVRKSFQKIVAQTVRATGDRGADISDYIGHFRHKARAAFLEQIFVIEGLEEPDANSEVLEIQPEELGAPTLANCRSCLMAERAGEARSGGGAARARASTAQPPRREGQRG